MIKTFRGLLADGGQDQIRLQTIKGKVGYKVVKFQILRTVPTASTDHVVKIFKEKQSTVLSSSATINLTEADLLAVGALSGTAFGEYYTTIIFDQETVNQDIFVTHTDNDGTEGINYYIELKVITLDDAGAEYTTIKDMRTRGF